MTQTALDQSTVQELARRLHGRLIRPEDPAYDETRKVFNGMIDHRPALIAVCADTADVQAAVVFAREQGLEVSVRGGGHGVQGYAVTDGGLMIDLSGLKSIKVDAASQVAVAGGGVNWGEFDAATQEHGLAVTGGRNPTTGIGGLTLGSGSGWLERKLGYTVDNMLAVEIVTADGKALRASESENADLFWGLRGGGGNFGVVTEFTYKLHKVGPIVFGGLLGFPRFMAKQVIRAYRDFIETAPDDVGGAVALITAPREDPVPPPVQGMPVLGIVVCYTGNPEDGPAAIKPLLDLNPVMNMVQPMPYVAVQDMLTAGNPAGLRNYWKADMYPEMPDELIDAIVDGAEAPLSEHTTIILQPLGGKVHRVDENASAMGWRKAKWALHILGMWENAAGDEAQIAWVRKLAAAAAPYAQKGTYLNYLMDEGEQRVKDSFGEHYKKIVELKNKYDPQNLFHLNQNIRPSTNGH